jgi:hypothetical protein
MVEPGADTPDEELEVAKFLFERTFTMDPQAGDGTERIPDGAYTTQVTKEDAVRLGVEDECTIDGGMKTVTLVLDAGSFSELQTCGDGPTEEGSNGIYELDGDRLVFSTPGYPGWLSFDWSFDDGTLTLSNPQTDVPSEELHVIRYLFENEFELAAS